MRMPWPCDTEELFNTDCHMHTKYCGHATGEMEQYVENAIKCGFKRILFLAHLESGIKYHVKNWLSPDEFKTYFQTGFVLRRKYKDIIDINLGAELGFNPDRAKELRALKEEYPFDAVGLSYHYIKNTHLHTNICSRRPEELKKISQYDPDWLIPRYYRTLLEGIKAIKPDFLCHFDVVCKSLPVEYYRKATKEIEALLNCIADQGIGVEINTYGFSHRGEQYPCTPVLKEVFKRNIKVLVGSDSHAPHNTGRGFDEAARVVGEIAAQFKADAIQT